MLKTAVKTVLPEKWVKGLENLKNSSRYTYDQDGLKTLHSADFMGDPKFAKAYEAGASTGSWGGAPIHWRAFVVCWAADIGSRLEGDFVDCGVNKGGLARTVAEYVDLKTLSKHFFLLDTYEGLAAKYLTQAEKEGGIREEATSPATTLWSELLKCTAKRPSSLKGRCRRPFRRSRLIRSHSCPSI